MTHHGYDQELDRVTRSEFWRRFHATPGYPSTERLSFVDDPVMRRQLLELLELCKRNDHDPRVAADIEQANRAERERQQRAMLSQALHGKLGRTPGEREEARLVAERLVPINPNTGKRNDSQQALMRLGEALRSIREARDPQPIGGWDEMGA